MSRFAIALVVATELVSAAHARSSAGFTVSNGQILTPTGQPFIACGIAVDSDFLSQAVASESAKPLTTDFRGVNFVRVVIAFNQTGRLPSLSSIERQINILSQNGIVAEIQYGPFGSTITGPTLQKVANWYGQAAAAFKGEPYVWFASQNEPGVNNVSDEMSAIYNAVRGAGNSAPFLLTPHGGGNDTKGMDPSVIQGMNNVVWDLHFYNWIANYSTSASVNQQALVNEVNKFRNFTKSADGTIPVIIGEYGNSTDGNGADPGWEAAVQAVEGSGYGSVAWGWNPGGSGDQLFDGNNPLGGLSRYGQMVAQHLATRTDNGPFARDPSGGQHAGRCAVRTRTGSPSDRSGTPS